MDEELTEDRETRVQAPVSPFQCFFSFLEGSIKVVKKEGQRIQPNFECSDDVMTC